MHVTKALLAYVLKKSFCSYIQPTVVPAQENGKRKHSNGGGVEKVPRLEAQSSLLPTRRSTRKGRGNDEVKFEVSSTQTLRDLKMQVPQSCFLGSLCCFMYVNILYSTVFKPRAVKT